MLLIDDDSDDLVKEGGIEEELEVKNKEELNAGCGKKNVSLFKFKLFKYFKSF